MPAPSGALRTRVFRLTAVAAAVHLGCDALSSRLLATTPPYLLLQYADEAFRTLLSPIAVSIATSAVNGAIAGLIGAALEESPRRLRAVAVVLTGLWLLSSGLLALIYLSVPWGIALGGLAAGVPRGLAVAWAVDRTLPPASAPPA